MRSLLLTLTWMAVWTLSAITCTSCTLAARTKKTHPTGEVSDTTLLAQLGGRASIDAPEEGGLKASANNEKSFRDGALAATAMAYTLGNVSLGKAESADEAVKTATKAGAATEQTRIGSIERTATTLGSNPEANVGAIDAAGNAFR